MHHRFLKFTKKHPVLRGMITYAILWPSSNLCQQAIQRRDKFNYAEMFRFSIFGSFFVAPSIYLWVRTIGYFIPAQTLQASIRKVMVEQVVYAPYAISTFYIGMGLLEGRNISDSVEEVKEKFIPTYKTALCIWPAVQTLNFTFIKERNRVAVTGVVSFFWTVFLSYMKQLDLQKNKSLEADNIAALSNLHSRKS